MRSWITVPLLLAGLAAPSFATGTMAVDSNVPARVFLDDVYVGLSPLTLRDLPAGEHVIRLHDPVSDETRGKVLISPSAAHVEESFYARFDGAAPAATSACGETPCQDAPAMAQPVVVEPAPCGADVFACPGGWGERSTMTPTYREVPSAVVVRYTSPPRLRHLRPRRYRVRRVHPLGSPRVLPTSPVAYRRSHQSSRRVQLIGAEGLGGTVLGQPAYPIATPTVEDPGRRVAHTAVGLALMRGIFH